MIMEGPLLDQLCHIIYVYFRMIWVNFLSLNTTFGGGPKPDIYICLTLHVRGTVAPLIADLIFPWINSTSVQKRQR